VNRVRIGNGCGFWGDNLDAPIILAEKGRLDYLTLEYLAELTMSILALQKQRDPEAGYATDFLDVLERLAPILKRQSDLKIVTNAGGMNPGACANRARSILEKHGLGERRIGVIAGDDLMPRLDQFLEQGHTLSHLDISGATLALVRSQVVSANAYLGAAPIARALRDGAAIVITGRVADASLTVGPAAHELGWAWDDWNRLAAGTVAGHLIECGAQATGGLYSNWREVPNLADVGYPIAELDANGTFTISKPPDTGGLINRDTIAEQLLYEVGDPSTYLTPDVTADFTSVALTEASPDTVQVAGANGKPATDTYKVSIAYRDHFSASGTLVIAGPDAAAKARLCGEMILRRLQRSGHKVERSGVELLGTGVTAPEAVRGASDPPEVVLRVAVRDSRRTVVERFAKEFAPLVTSGPPGVTGYATGRPVVREVYALWPALISKRAVVPEVRLV
jgi:hypothetical protein